MNVMTYKKSFGRRFLLASPLALLVALGSTSCTKPGQTAVKGPKQPVASGTTAGDPDTTPASNSVPVVVRCSLEKNAQGSYDFPENYSTPTELPGGWRITQENKQSPKLIADNVGGDDLIGGNLLISTSETKVLLQVLLLPKDVSADSRIKHIWKPCSTKSPKRDTATGRGGEGGGAGSGDGGGGTGGNASDETPDLGGGAVSDTPTGISSLPDADWYFVTSVEAGAVIDVTLPLLSSGPGTYSYCQENDKPGASTVKLKVGELHSINVTNKLADPDACTTPTPKKVYIVPSDALALSKDDLFTNPALSLVDETSLELHVESKLAAMDALRRRNAPVVTGRNGQPLQATLISVDGKSLTYMLQKQGKQRFLRDDFPLGFQFDSAALRKVEASAGKNAYVFRADNGAVVAGDAAPLSPGKVHLPTSIESAQIAPAARPETLVPLDPKLSLFVRDGMNLSCLDSSGKATWADCVVVRQNSDGLWAIINKREARNLLGVSGQSLHVEHGLLPSDNVVAGDTLKFDIGTYACRYSMKQLTRVMAGVDEGQVLYLVEAHRDGCLNRPLVLGAADAGAQLAFAGSEWFSDTDKENAKILKVSLGKIANSISGTKTYALNAHQSLGASSVEIEDGKSVTLMVEDGNDEAELTVDVQISPEHVLPRRLMENQPFVGIGLHNELYVPSAFGDKPWRVRLDSNAEYASDLPSAAVPRALIRVPRDGRTLPRISDGKGWRYSFTANDKAEHVPPLRADLTMPVSELLIDGDVKANLASVIRDKGKLENLLDRALNAGNKAIVLPAKARRYWLPMDLRNAGIVCGAEDVPKDPNRDPKKDPNLEDKELPGIVLARGQVTQALARKEYNGCKLVIPVNPSELPLKQKFSITVATEGAKVKSADLGPITFSESRDETRPRTSAKDQAFCDKLPTRPARCRVFDLDPLLLQLEDPSAYTVVKVTVAHPTTDGDLSQAYVPIQGNDDRFVRARNSSLTVSTRIMPPASWRCDPVLCWGGRVSLSVVAGVSGVNTHPGGYGVETSTSYANTFRSQFDYGAVLSVEPWDFSANDVKFPFAPQVMVGVLGPKEAKPTFSKDISVVGGFGFRVPTATSTATGPFVAGTSLIVWYAGHWGGRSTLDADGRDDTWVHSLLLGANVSLGASL